MLKFETARNLWSCINAACLIAALVLLKRMLPEEIDALLDEPNVVRCCHARNHYSENQGALSIGREVV